MLHEYKPQLRAELIKRLRAGENLLQAQVNIQRELLDALQEASDQIKDEFYAGKLR